MRRTVTAGKVDVAAMFYLGEGGMMNSGRIRMRLLAGVALTGAALAAIPTSAAVMRATYVGTVSSGENTRGAAFGIEEGQTLGGLAAEFILEYDPSTPGAFRDTSPSYDNSFGGTDFGYVSPFLSAVATINGVTRSVDPSVLGQAGAYNDGINSSLYSNVNYRIDGAGEGNSRDDLIYVNVGGGATDFPANLEVEVPLTALDPLFFASPAGFGQFRFVTCETAGIFQCGPDNYLEYTSGSVNFTSVTVENIGGTVDPPVIPLPAALPLLVTAFGGLGFAARRRQARV
jgi:hypothetical protein